MEKHILNHAQCDLNIYCMLKCMHEIISVNQSVSGFVRQPIHLLVR